MDADKGNVIKSDIATLIASTSTNTGMDSALAATTKGYKTVLVIIVMAIICLMKMNHLNINNYYV